MGGRHHNSCQPCGIPRHSYLVLLGTQWRSVEWRRIWGRYCCCSLAVRAPLGRLGKRQPPIKWCPQDRRAGNVPSAFTLVELLVVIGILAVLAALLLPVLSKAKNKAIMMTDVNNLKQMGVALHLYVADNSDALPWPNWFAGDVVKKRSRPGWLYTLDTSAFGHARFKVETGLFWKTLGNPKLYMCPMDNKNTELFAKRDQQILG
jgi:prepilin-type N-terminal cleavage/methylation domain-containing protein